MPEFYAEPMKDRKTCSVCEMTAKEKGKKVLLTCEKCHAITDNFRTPLGYWSSKISLFWPFWDQIFIQMRHKKTISMHGS